jgi:hypothetical protein
LKLTNYIRCNACGTTLRILPLTPRSNPAVTHFNMMAQIANAKAQWWIHWLLWAAIRPATACPRLCDRGVDVSALTGDIEGDRVIDLFER